MGQRSFENECSGGGQHTWQKEVFRENAVFVPKWRRRRKMPTVSIPTSAHSLLAPEGLGESIVVGGSPPPPCFLVCFHWKQKILWFARSNSTSRNVIALPVASLGSIPSTMLVLRALWISEHSWIAPKILLSLIRFIANCINYGSSALFIIYF